MALKPTLCVCH